MLTWIKSLSAQSGASQEFTAATAPLVEFWAETQARLPGIGIGLLIFIIIILLAGPLSRLFLKPFNYVTKSDLIRTVSRRAMSFLIILLGCYLFLKLAGLSEFAVAIISGTGVIGLIIGFAFRDIAENFISSLLLTVQRPFRLGDVVQINDYIGVVQKVTARATTLVDYDGNHIQIPNATIYKGVIKNLTANPKMRGQYVIGIGYDSDSRVAQQLLMNLLESHPHVLDDPEPQVLIDNLGSATINLKVYFWINVETTSVVKMASALMRRTVETFDQQGVSMPDDAREIVFPQGVPVTLLNGKSDNVHQPDEPPATTQPDKNAQVDAIPEPVADHHEDVSSETDEIRKQAAQSRDPEVGGNIL